MKIKIIFSNLLLLNALTLNAQVSDTIFTFKERIGCTVKEVGIDEVKYSFPGEEVVNLLSKTKINRIVYKNGREQLLNSEPLIKNVRYIIDWEKVTVTKNESDVEGLEKRKELNSIIRSKNLNLGYEATIQILKKRAALRGYAAVLVAFDAVSWEAKYGDFRSQITGLSFAIPGSIPNLDQFQKKVGNTTKFKILKQYSVTINDLGIEDISGHFKLQKTSVENGRVFLLGNMGGLTSGSFRLVYLGSSFFVVHYEGENFEYEYELRYE